MLIQQSSCDLTDLNQYFANLIDTTDELKTLLKSPPPYSLTFTPVEKEAYKIEHQKWFARITDLRNSLPSREQLVVDLSCLGPITFNKTEWGTE